ncbi:hypothetical protein E2542_SST16981 [Spatholobus suberectus]|nr:hypothetical protein E2542_SST16981 [Spatholobus suberectus]
MGLSAQHVLPFFQPTPQTFTQGKASRDFCSLQAPQGQCDSYGGGRRGGGNTKGKAMIIDGGSQHRGTRRGSGDSWGHKKIRVVAVVRGAGRHGGNNGRCVGVCGGDGGLDLWIQRVTEPVVTEMVQIWNLDETSTPLSRLNGGAAANQKLMNNSVNVRASFWRKYEISAYDKCFSDPSAWCLQTANVYVRSRLPRVRVARSRRDVQTSDTALSS